MSETIHDWDQNMAQVTTGSELVTTGSFLLTDGVVAGHAILDPSTEGQVVVDHHSYGIHEGEHFYMEGFTTLGSAGTLYVKLVVPDLPKRPHFHWTIQSSGILESNFYEDVAGGMAGGVPVTPLNNNRNDTGSSILTLTKGVSVGSDLGTTISSMKVGGTGFKTVTGGGDTRSEEIILKQDTTYLREFISSSDDNIVSFRAMWFEHTDRN